MQDDLEEKSAEIGRMEEIYSNSTMNLTAAGALSCSDGLFCCRDMLSVTPCYWT